MRKVTVAALVSASAALGLWSGNTAARHAEDSEIFSGGGNRPVWIDLPVFVVSTEAKENHSVHVRMSASVAVDPVFAKSPGAEDRISDAVLQATLTSFAGSATDNMNDVRKAEEIAAAAAERLGGSVLSELKINKLTAFRFRPRH